MNDKDYLRKFSNKYTKALIQTYIFIVVGCSILLYGLSCLELSNIRLNLNTFLGGLNIASGVFIIVLANSSLTSSLEQTRYDLLSKAIFDTATLNFQGIANLLLTTQKSTLRALGYKVDDEISTEESEPKTIESLQKQFENLKTDIQQKEAQILEQLDQIQTVKQEEKHRWIFGILIAFGSMIASFLAIFWSKP